MHLRAVVITASVLLAAACAAAPIPEEAPLPDTVPALRYRRLAYDAMAWHDGTGRPIEEIWFPERGIVANVTEEYSFDEAPGGTLDIGSHPEFHAFYSPILNRYPETFLSGAMIESPTEEIRVPRALAERMFRMADLDRELKEGRIAVGRDAKGADVLRFVAPGEAK